MIYKILIIDDEPDIVDFVKVLLETIDDNYEIYTASEGEEGLKKLEELGSVHLILLDVMMKGGKDGIEVCSIIKQNPLTKDIPIYMFSAKVLKTDQEAALSVGADGYIIKPIEIEEFVGLINKVCRS